MKAKNGDARVLTVHAQIGDGREIRRIEAKLCKYATILSETSIRGPDGKGRYPIVAIVYTVLTPDPSRLKNALSHTEKNTKSRITVY